MDKWIIPQPALLFNFLLIYDEFCEYKTDGIRATRGLVMPQLKLLGQLMWYTSSIMSENC